MTEFVIIIIISESTFKHIMHLSCTKYEEEHRPQCNCFIYACSAVHSGIAHVYVV